MPCLQPYGSITVLTPGTKVLVQNALTKVWDKKGVIQSCDSKQRSYHIELEEDQVLIWRNRKFLHPLDQSVNEEDQSQECWTSSGDNNDACEPKMHDKNETENGSKIRRSERLRVKNKN